MEFSDVYKLFSSVYFLIALAPNVIPRSSLTIFYMKRLDWFLENESDNLSTVFFPVSYKPELCTNQLLAFYNLNESLSELKFSDTDFSELF